MICACFSGTDAPAPNPPWLASSQPTRLASTVAGCPGVTPRAGRRCHNEPPCVVESPSAASRLARYLAWTSTVAPLLATACLTATSASPVIADNAVSTAGPTAAAQLLSGVSVLTLASRPSAPSAPLPSTPPLGSPAALAWPSAVDAAIRLLV